MVHLLDMVGRPGEVEAVAGSSEHRRFSFGGENIRSDLVVSDTFTSP